MPTAELSRPQPVAGAALQEATRLLHTAALARAVDEPDCADRIVPLLRGRLGLRPLAVDLAIDAAVRDAAHDLLSRGWTPAEVHRFAARRLDRTALTYLLDALAGTARGAATVPWLGELRALSAGVWWSSRQPHITQWSARHERGRPETLRVVVDVLALLCHLPRTDAPLPGMPAPAPLPPTGLVQDERLAGKIDALLARATASDFPDEAAACAAKAQELLLRHATTPEVRRAVLDDPRRIVVAVGAEVAGLLQRAVRIFARRSRGDERDDARAGSQAPKGRSW